MNSFELVRKSIRFESPDRVPLYFPWLDVSDIVPISMDEPGNWKPAIEGEREWGDIWEKSGEQEVVNMGYQKEYPIKTITGIKSYKTPDPYDESRYLNVRKQIEDAGNKYKLFGWFTLFEKTQQLIGMENLFIYLYESPNEIKFLIEKIYDYIMGALNVVEQFKNDIHAVHLGDDWGTQQAPLMSIEMFREFYKPYYAEIIKKIHGMGMDVWLHSDGKINDLIEEFIDIKLDVINLQQCNALGIEDVQKRYQGRITFDCPVDIQRTLPSGTKKQIEREAKILIEQWGTAYGGFIATDYGSTDEDHQAIGCSKEQAQLALSAFRKLGNYKNCSS